MMKNLIPISSLLIICFLGSCKKQQEDKIQPPVLYAIKDPRVNPDSIVNVKIIARYSGEDKLVFTMIDNPGFLSLSEGNQSDTANISLLSISPKMSDAGNYKIKIKAADVYGNEDTIAFNVEVFEDHFNYTTKIVYVSNGKSIYIMNADGTDKKQLTNGVEDFDPIFSADKTKILYVSIKDVWIMNANGSNKVRLTYHNGIAHFPHFSTDGTKIIYSLNEDTGFNIMVMNADGTNPKVLVDDDTENMVIAISPCNDKIAYVSQGYGGISKICLMNLDGSNKSTLVNPTEYSLDGLHFSTDGEKIIYTKTSWYRINDITYYNSSLYAVEVSTGISTDLNLSYSNASFSLNGDKIVCTKSTIIPLGNNTVDFKSVIFLMNLDGSHKRQLTEIDGNNNSPDW